MLSHFSHVRLFAAPWTIAHQAFLSIEFSRQGYWSGLPCPPPGESPNPGIKPASPALQAEVTYPKCRARIWIQAYIFPNFTFFSLICYLPGNRRKNLREQWSLPKTPPKILSYQAPLLSCVQLFGTPMDCNPTGSSVHVIFQERILEWMAISFSRGSSQPRDQTCVSCVLHWHVDSLPHTIWESSPHRLLLSYVSFSSIHLFCWCSEAHSMNQAPSRFRVLAWLFSLPWNTLHKDIHLVHAYLPFGPLLKYHLHCETQTMTDKTACSPGPVTTSTPNPSPLSLFPLVTIWHTVYSYFFIFWRPH